jgi:hypothetical protein
VGIPPLQGAIELASFLFASKHLQASEIPAPLRSPEAQEAFAQVVADKGKTRARSPAPSVSRSSSSKPRPVPRKKTALTPDIAMGEDTPEMDVVDPGKRVTRGTSAKKTEKGLEYLATQTGKSSAAARSKRPPEESPPHKKVVPKRTRVRVPSSSEVQEEDSEDQGTEGSGGEDGGKSGPFPGKVYPALMLAHSDPQGVDLSGVQVSECTPVDPRLVPAAAGKVCRSSVVFRTC